MAQAYPTSETVQAKCRRGHPRMPTDWGLARDYAAKDVQTEEMHVTEEWNTCTDPLRFFEGGVEGGRDEAVGPRLLGRQIPGEGFYKMTAAASALLVASQVMFMADEEYGREASLDARFMSPMIYGRIGIHTPFQTSPNYSRTTPARSSKTLASIIAQLCVTSSATPSVPPRRSTPPGSRV